MSDDVKLPEPAFQLRWKGNEGRYTVSEPNIGDTDVYTADQVRDAVLADRAHTAKLLHDPVIVHAGMLRGEIAKIEMLACAHIHGDDMVRRWRTFEESAPAQPADEWLREAKRLVQAVADACFAHGLSEGKDYDSWEKDADDAHDARAALLAHLAKRVAP